MSVGTREIGSVRPGAGARLRSVDNLKVLLVVGVIVAHATMAWTGQDQAWVLTEPAVREPLLTLLMLASLVGVMFAMATFFVLAGGFTPQSFARKGLRRYVGDRTLRLGVSAHRRSSLISTRGKPLLTASVSAALVKPALSNRDLVPT
jgi:hypothetical protein